MESANKGIPISEVLNAITALCRLTHDFGFGIVGVYNGLGGPLIKGAILCTGLRTVGLGVLNNFGLISKIFYYTKLHTC